MASLLACMVKFILFCDPYYSLYAGYVRTSYALAAYNNHDIVI